MQNLITNVRVLAIVCVVSCAIGVGLAQSAPKAKKTTVDLMTQAGQDALQKKHIGRRHTPSSLIIPDQVIPLRFSHQIHLKEDLTCMECHGSDTTGKGIGKSVRSGDINLPLEETCFNCHDVEEGAKADPPAACSTCHPGYEAEFPKGVEVTETKKAKVHPPAVVFPTPSLKMNHKVHIDLGIACTTCHGNLTNVDLATRENSLPIMGACLQCHDGKRRSYTKQKQKVHAVAPRECATCHLTEDDGRLRTNLAGGHLKPAGWYFGDAHDDQWLKNHKGVATAGDEGCKDCHAPKYCVDCHNGVSKPLQIHPNNWVLTHPIAARKNNPNCTSCHQSQTYCVTCHQQMKVGGDPGTNRPSATLKFHPDGWMSYGVRTPNHHAWQAQRNIQACASCHTEATCLTCHSAKFGSTINPHPPGFRGGRCRTMKRMNPRVCAKCHDPATPQYNCN